MPKSSLTNEELNFVDEYVRDFDFYAAAIRSGVPRLQAKKKGKLLMQSRTVLTEIAKRVDAMLPEQIVTPQRVLAGLMRETNGSFSKDRIAALKSAHDVLKDVKQQARKDKEDAESDERKNRGSGVMVVPGIPALTDWEAAARAQQAALKQKVKE